MCSILSRLNKCIENDEHVKILMYLQNVESPLVHLTESQEEKCVAELKSLKQAKVKYSFIAVASIVNFDIFCRQFTRVLG